jgi:hypothetical protein
MGVSATHTGWHYEPANSRLNFYYRGTRVGHIADTAMRLVGTLTVDGASTLTGAVAGAADITLTGAGVDYISASGNAQLGNPGTFASTQPQGAVVMGGSSLNGVAPAGAITTAGAVFASDTVVRKIIADGTASNVET